MSVKGAIESGSRIYSGGDIRVAGLVRIGVLSSEGSIILQEGVRGAGKARAKKGLELKTLGSPRG